MIRQIDSWWWFKANAALRLALLNRANPLSHHPLVNEYPKSGGSWLAQMLAEALAIPFPRNRLPMLRSSIMHGHYFRQPVRSDIVMVWRDGRDVMVSFYYHALGNNKFASDRLKSAAHRAMGAVDVEDIGTNLPRFIELLAEGRLHPGYGWSDFVAKWHGHEKVVAEVKYEDMMADSAAELSRVTAALGGELSSEAAVGIADRYSFRAQANRKAGHEDKTSYLRKGIAGDWQGKFSPAARQVFDHFHGGALVALGYELDSAWATSGR